CVHMQQHREAPAFEMPAQREVAADPLGFVEDGELDAFEALHQSVLDLTDDPDDTGVRPRPLNRAHDRTVWHVSPIADRRTMQSSEGGEPTSGGEAAVIIGPRIRSRRE